MKYTDIRNEAVLVNGLEVEFSRFMAVVVARIRDSAAYNGDKVSWEVIGVYDTGDSIRKKAKRLEFSQAASCFNLASPKPNLHVTWFNYQGREYMMTLEYVPTYGQLRLNSIEEAKVGSKKEKTPPKAEKVESKKAQFMLLPDSVVVINEGKPVIVGKDHINYNEIRNQLEKDGTYTVEMLEPVRILQKFSHAGLTYEDGQIKLDGSNFKYQLFDRLIEAIQSNNAEAELKKMFAFVRRAIENTSNGITERIFDFAKCNSIEFTDDGMMVCYKKVRADYKDCYTGTIDNSVGNIVSVSRNQVDENMDRTCSFGLHLASISYLKHYSGQRIVKCLLDPADVVAIPRDYNDSKLRTCKYTVLEDVTDQLQNHI